MSSQPERKGKEPAHTLLTDRATHELVMRLIGRDFPGGGQRREAIDVPCGAGALSVRLRDLGFSVTCCDIDPGHFEPTGFRHVQADLNKPLPLQSRMFDCVVSVAGLQRLHCPETAVSEFHRILKPGGTLYLSIPNYADLRRRLRFLLYGTLGSRFDNPKFRQTLDLPEAHFRFPLTYSRVDHMVRAAGLEIQEVCSQPTDLFPYFFLPLTLCVCAASWVRAMARPSERSSYRRGTTIRMLRSKAFVVIARKPTPAAGK